MLLLFFGTSVVNARVKIGLPKIDGSILRVPDEYLTIQAAVNAASFGDTVLIAPNVYYENVVVNKSLIIIGEDDDTTVVRGIAGNFTPTIDVRADYVEISGLTARNGYSGIYLNRSNYCNIHGNILTVTTWGGGINLDHSNNNTIAYNTAVNNSWGPIDLRSGFGMAIVNSNDNLITGNFITKNAAGGIEVYMSNGNILVNNTFYEGYGDITLALSNQTIVSGNRMENTNGIGIGHSFNNTVEDNWLVNGGGIALGHSFMNVIRGNTILHSCCVGISVADWRVGNNLVIENTISNSKFGIDISFSNYSIFYHNNLINNTNNHPPIPPTEQAKFVDVNLWNNSFGEGNYWSNYTGVDANRDGIGDNPHLLYADNVNYYPLMKPYVSGDVNHDSIVDIKDAARIGAAWNTAKGSGGYNPHADLNMDGVINAADADIIRKNWQKRF